MYFVDFISLPPFVRSNDPCDSVEKFCMMLAAPLLALGAELHLTGDNSNIHLGDAIFSGTCKGAQATVKYVFPTSFDDAAYSETSQVKAYLHGVPATCTTSSLRTPCAPINEENFPPLFYCNWEGPGGTATVSQPVKPQIYEPKAPSGAVLGYAVYVSCPVLKQADFFKVAGVDFASAAYPVTLNITHFAPHGDADSLPVPFAGLPAGNTVTWTIAAPPPPSPPPSPRTPPQPPVAPPPASPAVPPVCGGGSTKGSTSWSQHTSSSLTTTTSMQGCGFTEIPIVVSSVAGSSSHWQTTGGSEIYDISSTKFVNYVNRVSASPSQANSWNWHMQYLAALPSTNPTLCVGGSTKGSTSWRTHTTSSVTTTSQISQCGFASLEDGLSYPSEPSGTKQPVIVSAVAGSSSHWQSTGGSEVYINGVSSFENYVNGVSTTPSQANGWNWHMQWMAAPITTGPHFCVGRSPIGSTNWVQHTSTSIQYQTDISHCGFKKVTPPIPSFLPAPAWVNPLLGPHLAPPTATGRTVSRLFYLFITTHPYNLYITLTRTPFHSGSHRRDKRGRCFKPLVDDRWFRDLRHHHHEIHELRQWCHRQPNAGQRMEVAHPIHGFCAAVSCVADAAPPAYAAALRKPCVHTCQH